MAARRITTVGIEPEHRLRAWQDFHKEIFFDLDIVPGSGTFVDGVVTERSLGSVGVANGLASCHRIIRHRSGTSRGTEESFLLTFVTEGEVDYTHRHRRHLTPSGGIVLVNAAEPYTCDVLGDPSAATLVKIPCHVLRARLPWVDEACVADWLSRSSLVPSVGAFLRSLNQDAHETEAYRDLERACIDLVTTMLDSGRRNVTGAENSEEIGYFIVERLRRYIQLNLGKIDLGAADAASAFKISERQVQKLFQTEGTTFGRELMSARLHRANEILTSAAGQKLSINEISFRCGFTNQAHFSSRFRAQFNVSPRDRRAGKARQAPE